jgi:peptide/nickel transport system substrate-binding protein
MNRVLLSFLTGGALVLAVAALGPAMAADPDTLVIGKSGDPDNLDPAVTVTNNSWTATYPCYERLVRFKEVGGKGSTEVEGEVASSWTASPDAKVWTFTLGSGHTFSDGSPVDAAAVKASFERVIAAKKGPADLFDEVDHIDAPNDHTVVFTLKDAFAAFLSTLVDDGASIVNPAAVKQHESNGDLAQGWLADHSAGSGPYQIESWEKSAQIVLTPNPHWSGKTTFKRVEIRIIKEASARRLQLEKGDLDIIEDVPVDQLKALGTTKGINVVDEPSFSVTYLYLNNTHPPLDNVKVRQAISWAVDYQGIINGILLGQGAQMQGDVPVGLWGHDEHAMQFHYDPAKAKALLAEAGVKSAKLGFLYAKTDPNWESIGLVLQQNLAAIGITVDMQENAYPTMRERLNKGDFDIAAGNWTPDYADPSMFMNFWFDSSLKGLPGDRAFYSNPKVDELIRAAKVAPTQADRLKLYDEAQKITVAEAPYVLLFQRNYQFAMRDNVKGYVYNPMQLQIFNLTGMSKN